MFTVYGMASSGNWNAILAYLAEGFEQYSHEPYIALYGRVRSQPSRVPMPA